MSWLRQIPAVLALRYNSEKLEGRLKHSLNDGPLFPMKKEQLVPERLLQESDKILFVTHLAIGDYTYLQTFFRAFAEKQPHLKIDLWIDQVSRTSRLWRRAQLENHSLHEWVEGSLLFHKVYKIYSPQKLRESIEEARGEEYPIVVSLSILRPYSYGEVPRKTCPHGFAVGTAESTGRFFERKEYQRLDATFARDPIMGRKDYHITEVYAAWFEVLFKLKVDGNDRAPFIAIPQQWTKYARLKCDEWGIHANERESSGTFFINAFAGNDKRSWPLRNVVELVSRMKRQDSRNKFIVNSPPSKYSLVNDFLGRYGLENVHAFTASESFFQLPSIMSLCDMVISVETSTIHLASALTRPVVALMRQKNPEWAPWDRKNCVIVPTKRRWQRIRSIQVGEVHAAVEQLSRRVFQH